MHCVSLFIQSYFTLHDCSGGSLIASPRDSSAGKSFAQQERTSHRRPRVCLTERGREMCGCESVITNVQTMCRHAVRQLEFAHAVERVLESMRSLQQCDELLPTPLKTPGFDQCLVLPVQQGSRPLPSSQQLLSFRVSNDAHVSRILATNSVSAGNAPNQSGANCWLQHTFVLSSTGLPNRKSPLRVSSQPESAGRNHTSSGA